MRSGALSCNLRVGSMGLKAAVSTLSLKPFSAPVYFCLGERRHASMAVLDTNATPRSRRVARRTPIFEVSDMISILALVSLALYNQSPTLDPPKDSGSN